MPCSVCLADWPNDARAASRGSRRCRACESLFDGEICLMCGGFGLPESNFVAGNVTDEDVRLFFGDEPVTRFSAKARTSSMLREAGVFRSAADADRAGFSQPPPVGWSDHVFGKRPNQRRVFILRADS